MDYKQKSTFDKEVNSKLNDMFHRIIEDIPAACKNQSTEIALVKKGDIISYEKFCVILYKSVLDYIPEEGENPLVKAIAMLPRFVTNVKRIKANKEIKKLQKIILNKYFYLPGDDNIKSKVKELKSQIGDLEEDDYQILDNIMERFEDRIRTGFLTDMSELARLMEKRK